MRRVAEGARYAFKADPYSSHAVALAWLGEGGGRRLLDVGAADGLLARPLTARGWRVTAIETDAAAAAAGAPHCERMLVADLDREVPPLAERFEAIVCGDVLEHLRDPGAVLAALTASLAPGGRVLVSVPNVAHLWIRLCLLAGRFEYADRGILDRTHLRFFTLRSLRALLDRAGLRVLRTTATPVPLYQVVPARYHWAALAGVHAASAAAARALPRLLGYQHVVLAARG
ncbi:MAG TPA: class I SAM-dependent methyltransferase [Methylomirabilota bacterium]|nr:class I SAM-dependent methyltransferase [Methylomirabilota bacterium]